jgi:hypothetical protein
MGQLARCDRDREVVMRSILFALAMLGAGLSSPAWSQSWSGALPAVQGEERTLTFEVANLGDLVAWNIYLAFSPLAFATPGIVPSIVLDPALDTFEAGPALAPVASDFADPIPAGYLEIVVSASHVFPISGSGALLTAKFSALPAALGPTQVFSRFYYASDAGLEQNIDLAPLSTSIAAIPEPQAWAMMLAGLGLVGFCAARRRNTRA